MTVNPVLSDRSGNSADAGSALDLRDITVSFPLAGGSMFRRNAQRLTAVDQVSLQLRRGEALGLVGESGCGKTTLGRTVVGQTAPDSGEIVLSGQRLDRKRDAAQRRRIQMVFQDPMSSLNPRLRIGDVLAELLRVNHMVPDNRVSARVDELLSAVGLPQRFRDVHPRLLSGGQRQRVSIARALALEPEVLVADEITSALDVSIQAQVLSLLLDLKDRLDLTVLFISHNLAVVRQVCERVAVMYLGRIVELGPTETVFSDPQHPYTRLLLSSIPRLDGKETAVPDSGEVTRLEVDAGSGGCRFAPRCPLRQQICLDVEPSLAGEADHGSACHFSFGRRPETVPESTPA
jgi:oligopeptide/dipeptide ABC transporter ATP-binding protein